jgi:hypothetical protein
LQVSLLELFVTLLCWYFIIQVTQLIGIQRKHQLQYLSLK